MAEEVQFKINDRVVLTNSQNKDQEGVILYKGNLEGKEGIWIGVELDLKNGSHNGQFNGTQYFICKDGHGLFVREKHLQLIQSEVTVAKEKIEQQPQQQAQQQQPAQVVPAVEKKAVTKPSGVSSTAASKTGVTAVKGVVTAVKTTKVMADKSAPATKLISSQSSANATSLSTSTSAAASSLQAAKHQEELQFKESEINILKEELEIKEFIERIGELQNQVDEHVKSNSEQSEQMKQLQEQIQTEQQKQSDTYTQLLQQKEDYQKLEEELEILHDALKQAEESEQLLEGLTIQKETLEHKVESLVDQLRDKDLQIQKLNQEKQLAQIELEEAMKGIVPDGESLQGDQVNTDLMKSNARLKQAVQILNDQYELEKIELLEQIIELEAKSESLPELEKKITELEQQIQQFKTQIQKKNVDIEELKERLDEQQEAVDVVENITQKNEELEDKITDLKKEIKIFKETKRDQDDIIENYDELFKEKQDEVNQLEYQIYEQKRLVQEKDEQLADQEKTIEKLKQRARIYKEQSESIKMEANESAASSQNTEGKQGTNIQKLLEAQQELFQEKREIYKKYLDSSIQIINTKVETKCKSNVYLSCIPDVLTQKISSDGIKILINAQKNIKKTNLLHQELISYLHRHTDQIIKEENINLFLWVISLLEQTNIFIYYSRRQETLICNVKTIEELGVLIKSGSNSSFIAGGLFIESVLKQLMDDNISTKIALDPIITANNKLKEEDLSVAQNIDQQIQHIDVQLDQKFQYIDIQKNTGHIRVLVMQKIFLNKYINGSNCDILFNTLEKRIYEFNKNLETGVILNNLKINKLVECNTALVTVFESISDEKIGNFLSPLKTELKDDMDGKEESNEERQERERISQFRKVISDIANLLSSLNADADQKLQSTNVQKQNDILENNSYWGETTKGLKEQIENVESTIENEKKLSDELKTSKSKGLQQELEIENLNKIKQTLEQRVVKLQFTSEKVSALEAEKKRFADKEKSFNEASDIIQKELDNIKKKYRESQEEIKNLKNNPSRSSTQRNTQGPVLTLKSSMSKNFGDTPKLGSRQSIMFQQYDEDNFDLVRYYETENNILRSMNLKDRIKSLVTESTNLKLFKKLKDKNQNSENQLQFLSQQLNKASNVHEESLKLLASKQVIDLSELKEKNLSQKDTNIKEYLQNENKQMEALKFQAFKICSDFTKKIQKNTNSFKQRIEIPTINAACDEQNLKKIGSICFSDETAEPTSIRKLTVSLKDWQKIREIF